MPDLTGPQIRALPAGRALDTLLWECVFECRPELHPYSGEPAAMMELVAGMEELRWRVLLCRQPESTTYPWAASFLGSHIKLGRTPVQAEGPTPMLAVARAAALAVTIR